jgi:hypothetical protein
MASVVNVPEIQKRFASLGWTSLSISEVLEGLRAASVASTELIAYLDSLIATPAGDDDQAIAGCPVASANKITAFLKSKNVVV